MAEYDNLSPAEQVQVRARWSEAITRKIAELDLVSEFEVGGSAYSELDGEARVVTRCSGPS